MNDSRQATDPDEDALRTIREALNQTLFVEAGAGTGKTYALVSRVVATVLSGQSIDRIAAITFTERAAAELKDRVRQGLEKCLREQPETRDHTAPALESLDRAQISTIHSFCQELLHLFAAEAGVDPSFEVQDPVAAERRFRDRWRGFIENLSGDDEAADILDRVLGLGLTTGDLEELARELASRAELVPVLRQSMPATPAPDWTFLPRSLSDLQKLVPGSIPDTDKLRLRIEKLARLIEELVRNPAEREATLAAAVSELGDAYGRLGTRDNWANHLTSARETCKQVHGALVALLADCRSEALSRLIPLIVRFVDEDAQARGRDGLMTFDDLILRIRDLLGESTQAVQAFREKYDTLLIDEFQDTDPLQVEIALAFATDPDTRTIEPGRLFLVGDPKQSIYRFRRADMAVYSRTSTNLDAAGAARPQLRRNRRSRPAIIEWVNQVFAGMIGSGDTPSLQPEYREILPFRETELRGAGVACFGGEIDDGSLAGKVRAMESRDVAACCRAIIEEGWEVSDKPDEAHRPASYRDIAILIPTRTGLTSLERSLTDAGVPYRVEGGSLIYRTQEVRDLLNSLTAIDDPADEVAIVGALRSPAFACSDLDIARFVSGGGRIGYLRGDLSAATGPVADGLRILRDFHGRRQERSLAALVEEFVADRRLAETGILDRADRNSFRRMRYLVEQARSFEANGPESLRALVQWLEGCSQQQMLDNEGAGLDDDEDAVRVLTIHGAKGLEFPIVIMAGMAAAPNLRSSRRLLIDRSDDSVAVQTGKSAARFRLGDVETLENVEKEHARKEFVRLLYVAATRARDHLVFSLYRTPRASKENAAADQLEKAGACEAIPALQFPPAPVTAQRPFEGVQVDEPVAATPEEFDEQRRQLVGAARTQTYTSATRLGRTTEAKDAAEDDTEPWSRGRAGTRLGRAVHAAIQSLPLHPDDVAIEAFSRAQAVAEAIPNRAPDVARLVRAAFSSGAAQRARAAPRALREVPFAVTVDGVIVEGFVDMLIESPDGLEIVDWKTDRVAGEEVHSRLAEYRLQAGLYVLGIEEATRRRVHAVTYVFVSAGREESSGDPAGLAGEARARVAAGVAGPSAQL
ncbi:MAG TPA: UvrD-helicase domain-containing protein [Dehalococcoidia bacterium]|nr:UvrD-helicase domain-containing protein [Dehalococcoidia bacterium]